MFLFNVIKKDNNKCLTKIGEFLLEFSFNIRKFDGDHYEVDIFLEDHRMIYLETC